jgi:hypothetical protein
MARQAGLGGTLAASSLRNPRNGLAAAKESRRGKAGEDRPGSSYSPRGERSVLRALRIIAGMDGKYMPPRHALRRHEPEVNARVPHEDVYYRRGQRARRGVPARNRLTVCGVPSRHEKGPRTPQGLVVVSSSERRVLPVIHAAHAAQATARHRRKRPPRRYRRELHCPALTVFEAPELDNSTSHPLML